MRPAPAGGCGTDVGTPGTLDDTCGHVQSSGYEAREPLRNTITMSSSGAASPEGTGFGLAIGNMAVRAHGGSLDYRPNRPRGACFQIRFPADTA